MINVVICCAGGFSSSFLARKVDKEIKEMGYEDKIHVIFKPFGNFKREHDECDVVMLCPHLRFDAENWLKENELDFPVYMIPTQIYGLIGAKTILEDAQDIIEVYKNNHINPAYFPGESDCTQNKRKVSYREEMKKKGKE